MFRVTPRTLGISPEDYNMLIQDKSFKYNREVCDCFNNPISEAALGANWRIEFDPEAETVYGSLAVICHIIFCK